MEEHEGITRFLSKNRNARFMNILALALVLYAMWYFGMLLFITVPEENIRFVDTIIGFLLGSVMSSVINYYFGSAAPTSSIREDSSETVVRTIQQPTSRMIPQDVDIYTTTSEDDDTL